MTLKRQFPESRMRRLRTHDWSRRLVRESSLSVDDLIYPIFVQEGQQKYESVESMPGVERKSVDLLVEEAKEVESLGIPVIALFPVIPFEKKSPSGEEALNPSGLTQTAVRSVKEACPG